MCRTYTCTHLPTRLRTHTNPHTRAPAVIVNRIVADIDRIAHQSTTGSGQCPFFRAEQRDDEYDGPWHPTMHLCCGSLTAPRHLICELLVAFRPPKWVTEVSDANKYLKPFFNPENIFQNRNRVVEARYSRRGTGRADSIKKVPNRNLPDYHDAPTALNGIARSHGEEPQLDP